MTQESLLQCSWTLHSCCDRGTQQCIYTILEQYSSLIYILPKNGRHHVRAIKHTYLNDVTDVDTLTSDEAWGGYGGYYERFILQHLCLAGRYLTPVLTSYHVWHVLRLGRSRREERVWRAVKFYILKHTMFITITLILINTCSKNLSLSTK